MPSETDARTAPIEGRILRRDDVELMKEGKFPKALRLGGRAVGWDSVELDEWIAQRLKNRVELTPP